MAKNPVTYKEPIIEGSAVTGRTPKGVWVAQAIALVVGFLLSDYLNLEFNGARKTRY
jgi:hypothetical protein